MPPHSRPLTDRLGVRQPIPLPGQDHMVYHRLHQSYGLETDGRCNVCFPMDRRPLASIGALGHEGSDDYSTCVNPAHWMLPRNG